MSELAEVQAGHPDGEASGEELGLGQTPMSALREALGGYVDLLGEQGTRREEVAEVYENRVTRARHRLERETEALKEKLASDLAEVQAMRERYEGEVREQLDTVIAEQESKAKRVLNAEGSTLRSKQEKLKKELKSNAWLADTVSEADERAAAALKLAGEKAIGPARERLAQLEEASREGALKRVKKEAEAAIDEPASAEPIEPHPKQLKPALDEMLLELENEIVRFSHKGLGSMLGMGKSSASAAWAELRGRLGTARARIDATERAVADKCSEILATAEAKKSKEKSRIQSAFDEKKAELEAKLAEVKSAVETKYGSRIRELKGKRSKRMGEIERLIEEKTASVRSQNEKSLAELKSWHDKEHAEAEDDRREAHAALARTFNERVSRYDALVGGLLKQREQLGKPWSDESWNDFPRSGPDPKPINVGSVSVDLSGLPGGLPEADDRLELPEHRSFKAPVMMDTRGLCSVLLNVGREARDAGLGVMRSVMLRAMTSLPPAKVRFTMFDPVGLGQSFSAFMHLADYSDLMVHGKIWTTARDFDIKLGELTEHIENVIQRYLRNEYETIEQYNRQAGEIAEPYRFLVVADFPTNFVEESAKKLKGIIETGPRCGVHTTILADPREKLPNGIELADIEDASVVIENERSAAKAGAVNLQLRDDVLGRFSFDADEPPADDLLTTLLHRLGSAATDAARVEVPFRAIAPKDGEFWTRSTSKDVRIPLGRTGATKKQEMILGVGTAQHAIIAGKTGSGKSTLLHAMITSASAWFNPDELEFYLIDFKAGVEFKTYAERQLPHAKVVSIETDRNFGLSVLEKVDSELAARGEVFRAFNVQNVAGFREKLGGEMNDEMRLAIEHYKQTGGNPHIPRVLLICDEFQELFTQDDRVAQESALILDRLVRQGRAFGIHVVLGSQTLGGAFSLARSTLGQMAVRVALQCNEQDSMLILGEENPAARLLTRPGEAIYNDAGGLIENNSHFQVVWMNDRERDSTLDVIRDMAKQSADFAVGEPIVFEGNKPALAQGSQRFDEMIGHIAATKLERPALAVIGEPLAIKEPTAAVLRREAAANVLIVGQHEEQSLAMLTTAAVSLAARDEGGQFFFIDGARQGEPEYGYFAKVTAGLPAAARYGTAQEAGELVGAAHAELESRRGGGSTQHSVYLFVYGLHRCRSLRQSDDFGGGFSFGGEDDGEAKADPAKQLAELLDEGPELGVHVLAWCDTAGSVERALGRSGIGHFDARVLFQMSQSDSITMMDNPAASNLGINNRALLYREQAGDWEVFRPFALPTTKWVRTVFDPE